AVVCSESRYTVTLPEKTCLRIRIQHDLARPSRVGQWSRTEKGLKRNPQSTTTILEVIRAYSEVVRYVQNVKAHRKAPPAEKTR
ncbi:MAG: hypothetical protein O3A63_17550, partial [Proteobacteria bacterium]|nr:hypothetical protein [Pseudomonadota bacterium]